MLYVSNDSLQHVLTVETGMFLNFGVAKFYVNKNSAKVLNDLLVRLRADPFSWSQVTDHNYVELNSGTSKGKCQRFSVSAVLMALGLKTKRDTVEARKLRRFGLQRKIGLHTILT